jgi:hypothetical protein
VLAAMEPGLGTARMGSKAQRPRTSDPQTLSIESDDANALRGDATGDGKRVSAERFCLMQLGQKFTADECRRRCPYHAFVLAPVVEDHL